MDYKILIEITYIYYHSFITKCVRRFMPVLGTVYFATISIFGKNVAPILFGKLFLE